MLQIRKVLQLLRQGHSQRSIARQVNISRNTVQDYCLKFCGSGLTIEELLSLDDHDLYHSITTERPTDLKDHRYQQLAPRLPGYLKELSRVGVTHLLLCKEYCWEESDPYSYQQFCFHLGNTSASILLSCTWIMWPVIKLRSTSPARNIAFPEAFRGSSFPIC